MSDTMQTISDDIIRNEEGRQWGETAFDNVKGYIGFLGEQIDGIREMLRMERREHEATKAMLLEAKPYTVGYDTDLPKRIDAALLARPEAREKVIDACLFAVQGERLTDPVHGETGAESPDEIYDRAVRDCEKAILALKTIPSPQKEIKDV